MSEVKTIQAVAEIPQVHVQNIATNKKSVYAEIIDRMKFRVHEDMLTLRYAVDDAENIVTYNRVQLHRIFRKVYLDPHLQSQWETRKKKTIDKEFKIVKAGTTDQENKQLTAILKSAWFYDLVDAILESKAWGFSVIELGQIQDGKFVDYANAKGRVYDRINQVDRDYIKPEFNIVTKNPEDTTGIQLDDPAFIDQLIFVGKRHDHGFLMSLVRNLLFKDNLQANWSEWAEVFGMDVRIGKTSAQNEDKNRFLQTLKGLASNGYGVVDSRDEVEFVGTAKSDAFQVYNAYIRYIDEQTSKKVFGQDVISNNTGHVIGKIGENVSNLYGDSDAKFVAAVINDECLKRFTALGLANFDGYVFAHDTTEKLTLEQRIKIDQGVDSMGYQVDEKYLTETYGTKIVGKKEVPSPKKETV